MARLLHFHATRTVSWNQFWILVPQELSHGTSFGFSCRKTCLLEPLLDFRAASLVSWNPFWILVPQDSFHGQAFGFSCRKSSVLVLICNVLYTYVDSCN